MIIDLIKIEGHVVRRARRTILQLTGVAVPKDPFCAILEQLGG